MKTLFRVVAQTEAVTINTKNGPMQKSQLVLQEEGGKYENSYIASLFGNQIKLQPGDYAWVSLSFQAREYNGTYYQDITIQGIVPFINR